MNKKRKIRPYVRWATMRAMAGELMEELMVTRSRLGEDCAEVIPQTLEALVSFREHCLDELEENFRLDEEEAKKPSVCVRELWNSDMPIRYVNLLYKGGYKTFEDLAEVHAYDLLKIAGLGMKSLDAIRESMREHGYYFATEGRMIGLVPGGAGPQGA